MEIHPLVLIIVDGFGIADPDQGNAIAISNTPVWDQLREQNSHVELEASGNAVGLPNGVMGNSEVGHLTIGSGRITYQALEFINRACKDGTITTNPVVDMICKHISKTEGRLHLMGLLSDGGVHSHLNHLYKLLDVFQNLKKLFIHAFTDGRDTSPTSGVSFVSALLKEIEGKENISLASIIGRFYAMDRDKKWERTKVAYDMLTNMQNYPTVNPLNQITSRYKQGETDEFMKPIVCDNSGSIQPNDAVIFFNFRPDRARQITQAIHGDWPYSNHSLGNVLYVTMTKYQESWRYPVFFETKKLKSCLAEVISKHKLNQVHIAETEKYAHVTYFLNGGEESPFENENRILIPSLKVTTYDLQPEMSTRAITEEVLSSVERRQTFVVVNIAAPDMVGHTGNLEATKLAVQFTDEAFGKIWKACKEAGYILCITSDHGNAEKLLDGDQIHTAHTNNRVPFLTTAPVHLRDGGLQDVAPTILEMIGISKPEEMTGESLISR